MARGRKITLYLVDGTANGIIKAQIGNWVGQITFGRVTQLIDLASDEDIKRPGVYILSGPDPTERNPEAVYIGESENVWQRIKQHGKEDSKAHFERVAIITSHDENLSKGHIRYLESRLIRLANETRRASVDNGTGPDLPPLPPADRDEMEGFLEQVQLILPVLGLNFVLPAPKRLQASSHAQHPVPVPSPIFKLTTKMQDSGIEVDARGQFIDPEFLVLAGSTAHTRMEGSYKRKKDQLIQGQKLVSAGSMYRFTEDIPFNSASAAAAVIRGQNTNGRTYWKLDNGMTFGEWYDARVEAEEAQSGAGGE